jgi:hypothetical protein
VLIPSSMNWSLAPVAETSTIKHSTGASFGRQIARAFKSVGVRRDERFSTERSKVAGDCQSYEDLPMEASRPLKAAHI